MLVDAVQQGLKTGPFEYAEYPSWPGAACADSIGVGFGMFFARTDTSEQLAVACQGVPVGANFCVRLRYVSRNRLIDAMAIQEVVGICSRTLGSELKEFVPVSPNQ